MHDKNTSLRKLPVLWITLSTFLIMFMVNLPLIYGYFAVHGKFISQLWGYAPHQFIFLLVPFPMATFATLVALTIIFTTLANSPQAHSLLQWCGKNWIVIILLGFILSATFAVFDYYGNPKVFDRLTNDFAHKAVLSADGVRANDLQVNDQAKIQQIHKEADIFTASLKNDAEVTREELLNLNPEVYIRVVKDGYFQRKFQMLDPVSHLLSELQLVFALFVGFGTLLATVLIFLSHFSTGVDLSKATPSVITALSFFALYPLCFSYWSAEINTLTGMPINNVGYLIVGGLILFVGLLLIIVDMKLQSIAVSLGTALPALLSVFALTATKTIGIDRLRVLIGVDANIATRFSILLSLLIIGIILTSMIVIQYEESFNSGS